MVTLISLPTDIKAYIVSYVVRQEDLRNLYRTCKDLYRVAIAFFYHSIIIDEHCTLWSLTGLFQPENEGLHHIRHVTIKTCRRCRDEDCEPEGLADAGTIHMMLAQLLPRDTLLTFR